MNYSENGKQYHINADENDLGKYVILPGDPGRVEKIAKYLDDAKFVSQNREYLIYTGKLSGEKVSVMSTGIGGPSAAIALEEAVKCGAHTFIRVGTCGGMQKEIKSGDIIVATGAVRSEGTSREYAPTEFPAVSDFSLTQKIIEACKEKKKNRHAGVVQCKDSFYGQHEPEKMPVANELKDKRNARIKLGVLASEMESAALFVVASFLKVKISSVFLTVANQEREKAGLSNPVVHDTESAIEIAVIAMKKAIEEDLKTEV